MSKGTVSISMEKHAEWELKVKLLDQLDKEYDMAVEGVEESVKLQQRENREVYNNHKLEALERLSTNK